MAEESGAVDMKKKRTFRKFTYRSVGMDRLLDMTHRKLAEILTTRRIRRRFSHGPRKTLRKRSRRRS